MLNTGVIQPETSLKPRILVADDHFLIAEAISVALAPNFDVVGVMTEAKLVADEVARLRPEVALLDVTMPGLSGLEVARMIVEQVPNTKIIFLTMHANRVILKEAFRAGASAFVVKSCAVSDLVVAVRTVLAGGTYVSLEVQEDEAKAPARDLSERQTTILRLIAQGCSSKQIGLRLDISTRTAEYHKSSIMEKLKLRSIAQLTRYAIEHGIGS